MFRIRKPTLFGRPEGVLSETRALRSTIAGLRRLSAALPLDAARAAVEARRLLANLSANLAVYFDARESADYFAAMLADCPTLATSVGVLVRDRAELRRSVTSAENVPLDGGDNAELGRRIAGVLEGFEKHELSENELLRRFFYCEAPSSSPSPLVS